MKNTKKILAAVMALIMLVCMIPMSASAAEASAVYVGELDKTRDNLVDLLREKGPLIRVKSVKNDENYYEFTHEDGVGYVLTFFNGYEMSEVIKNKRCGLYADGDLTVRLDVSESYKRNYPGDNADIWFDLTADYGDEVETGDANGWVVDGTLTIECLNTLADKAVLNVNGGFDQSDRNATGIKAQNLLLNNVEIVVNGGNVGVDVVDSIGMIKSTMKINLNDALTDPRKDPQTATVADRLCNFGFRAENLLEADSAIEERGYIRLKAYWSNETENNDNEKMDVDPHAYSYVYAYNYEAISLNWRQSFSIFVNPGNLPMCLKPSYPVGLDARPITRKPYVYDFLIVNGNKATVRRPTPPAGIELQLLLVCGQASYLVDSCTVRSAVRWWQRLPYILSFDWLH